MIVIKNKQVIGKNEFDVYTIAQEMIQAYRDKCCLVNNEVELGRVVDIRIKPNYIRIKTSLGHLIEYKN